MTGTDRKKNTDKERHTKRKSEGNRKLKEIKVEYQKERQKEIENRKGKMHRTINMTHYK